MHMPVPHKVEPYSTYKGAGTSPSQSPRWKISKLSGIPDPSFPTSFTKLILLTLESPLLHLLRELIPQPLTAASRLPESSHPGLWKEDWGLARKGGMEGFLCGWLPQ